MSAESDNAPVAGAREPSGRVLPDLTPAQLEQRLELAAALTARLAHDFGNALTGILGFAELALRELQPRSPAFRFMQESYQAGERASQWISKLRLFARRKPVRAELCDVQAVLDTIVARHRTQWGAALRLEVSSPARLPAVLVEAEALGEALQQVLDNAREAVHDAGLVSVSARETTLTAETTRGLLGAAVPGNYLELRFTDNGCGMTPEVRQSVFADPFFSSKPRKRGLGLLVVYGVLRACGGGLTIDSVPNQGTTVTLYLPQTK